MLTFYTINVGCIYTKKKNALLGDQLTFDEVTVNVNHFFFSNP